MAGDIKDTGFSDKGDLTGKRLLNRNGVSNIKKTGLGFFERFNLYHSLISINAWSFFLLIFGTYFVINLLFASLYVIVGIETLVDSSAIMVESPFLRAFFFSTQTLTTLGYGQMSPSGVGSNVIASIEAFLGLLLFALLTGLLYGRFSKPKAKLIYSEKALIAPYRDLSKGLMVRFGNAKNTTINNLNAVMLFSYIIMENGQKVRKYFNLELELASIKMLSTTWTLVHHLNEDSPLMKLDKEEMKHASAELIIQVEGYDETYNQQVSSRTSYLYEDFVHGAKFDRVLTHDPDGHPILDYSKLSSYELVDLS